MSSKNFADLVKLVIFSLTVFFIEPINATTSRLHILSPYTANDNLKIKSIVGQYDKKKYTIDIYSEVPRETSSDISISDSDAVLALGKEFCKEAVSTLKKNPIYCAFLSEIDFESVILNHEHRNIVAVVNEQSLDLQLEIIREYFPVFSKILILISDHSKILIPDVIKSDVEYKILDAERPISSQIAKAIDSADALLAIPDDTIYNSKSMRSILLTAYGLSKPLLGYNKSTVNAGSLFSTYSTGEDILSTAVGVINAEDENSLTGFSIYRPRQFRIFVNKSVAQSLDIAMPNQYNPDQVFENGAY